MSGPANTIPPATAANGAARRDYLLASIAALVRTFGDEARLDTPMYAAAVHSSERTAERQRLAGTGCPFEKVGGKVLYRYGDVLAFLASKKARSTSDATVRNLAA